MLRTSIALQDRNNGSTSAVITGIVELAASTRFRRMRNAVAYATRSGCHDLCHRLAQNMLQWRSIRKYWLISIDFGRTEVEAITYLGSLPNSEVRIPNASKLLNTGLRPECCFHPKTFIFDSGSDVVPTPFAIFIGSGNLTMSGLNTGVEHGTSLAWLPPLVRPDLVLLTRLQRQLSWWNPSNR
jgi:hypothetical protein